MIQVFDVGAGYGQNVNYYLRKSDRVIAVEAHPVSAQRMRQTFANAISIGRLIVVEAAVTPFATEACTFYVHTSKPEISRLVRPSSPSDLAYHHSIITDFVETQRPAVTIQQLVDEFGMPDYLKLDIEDSEADVLESFVADVRPRTVSAEFHSERVANALASAYSEFALFRFWPGDSVVSTTENGRTVLRKVSTYANGYEQIVTTNAGQRITYRFPRTAAGPYDNDLGTWINSASSWTDDQVSTYGPAWETDARMRPWSDLHARRPR